MWVGGWSAKIPGGQFDPPPPPPPVSLSKGLGDAPDSVLVSFECGASERALRTGSQGTSVVTAEGAYANVTEACLALTSVALQP